EGSRGDRPLLGYDTHKRSLPIRWYTTLLDATVGSWWRREVGVGLGAVVVGVWSVWVMSEAAIPVGDYSGCVDVLAPDPGLAEVFSGMRAYLASRPGALSGQPDHRLLPAEALGEAARADPEQIPRRQAVLDRIPPGGYAAYIRAVCPLQREFEGVERGVSGVRWAMAFDAVTTCLTLDPTVPVPDPGTPWAAAEGGGGDLRGRYRGARLRAAREYLCPP
ncbi:hypothetical protein ACWEKT_40765, partial [Nocardia takedensis]